MPSRKYRIVSVIGASLLVGIALGFLVGAVRPTRRASEEVQWLTVR